MYPWCSYLSLPLPGGCRHYTPAWEAAGQYAHKGAEGASQTTGGNIGGGGGSVPAAALKAAAAAIIRPDRAAGQLDKLYPGAPAWQQQLQNLPEWLNPYKSYYSFSMGSVHFLMLDSESPSPPGSPQHQFAANDLKQVGWVGACGLLHGLVAALRLLKHVTVGQYCLHNCSLWDGKRSMAVATRRNQTQPSHLS